MTRPPRAALGPPSARYNRGVRPRALLILVGLALVARLLAPDASPAGEPGTAHAAPPCGDHDCGCPVEIQASECCCTRDEPVAATRPQASRSSSLDAPGPDALAHLDRPELALSPRPPSRVLTPFDCAGPRRALSGGPVTAPVALAPVDTGVAPTPEPHGWRARAHADPAYDLRSEPSIPPPRAGLAREPRPRAAS